MPCHVRITMYYTVCNIHIRGYHNTSPLFSFCRNRNLSSGPPNNDKTFLDATDAFPNTKLTFCSHVVLFKVQWVLWVTLLNLCLILSLVNIHSKEKSQAENSATRSDVHTIPCCFMLKILPRQQKTIQIKKATGCMYMYMKEIQ